MFKVFTSGEWGWEWGEEYKKLFTFKFYFYSCFDVQKIYKYYLKTF